MLVAGCLFLVCTNILTVAIPKFIEHAIDGLDLANPETPPVNYALAIIGSGFGIIIRTLSEPFFNPGRTAEYDVKTAYSDTYSNSLNVSLTRAVRSHQ